MLDDKPRRNEIHTFTPPGKQNAGKSCTRIANFLLEGYLKRICSSKIIKASVVEKEESNEMEIEIQVQTEPFITMTRQLFLRNSGCSTFGGVHDCIVKGNSRQQ